MFKLFKKSGDRKDVTKRKGATIGQKIIGIVGLCIGLLVIVAVTAAGRPQPMPAVPPGQKKVLALRAW